MAGEFNLQADAVPGFTGGRSVETRAGLPQKVAGAAVFLGVLGAIAGTLTGIYGGGFVIRQGAEMAGVDEIDGVAENVVSGAQGLLGVMLGTWWGLGLSGLAIAWIMLLSKLRFGTRRGGRVGRRATGG